MKGMLLVGYKENLGSSIDLQYPSMLLNLIDIDMSVFIEIYEEIRAQKKGPSFIQKEIDKDTIVYCFYTGFSSNYYVGKPDHAILVLMSAEEIDVKSLEGKIRAFAHITLPKKEDDTFTVIFQEQYESLKNDLIEPYWEEVGEEGQALKAQIEEQDTKIQNWNQELTELNENNAKMMQKLRDNRVEMKELRDKIESQENEMNEMMELIEQGKQLAEELENQEQIMSDMKGLEEKVTTQEADLEKKNEEIEYLKDDLELLTRKNKLVEEQNKDIDMIMKENDNLKSDYDRAREEIGKLKQDNERFLSTITGLKLDLKEGKQKMGEEEINTLKTKDDVIEMKKELKIMRRERDHYKNIVKEKNLL